MKSDLNICNYTKDEKSLIHKRETSTRGQPNSQHYILSIFDVVTFNDKRFLTSLFRHTTNRT